MLAPTIAIATLAPTTTSAAAAPNAAHEGHDRATGADAGAVYTCPMHADVHSSSPGKCPKCGMTLLPQKP
jgi:Heavy metal binding domain